MKKILQNLLCVILITVLFGCSEETDNDRVKTINEYAGRNNYTAMNVYAPNQRNIKEQVITTKSSDDATLITTVKTNEKGQIINAQDKNLTQILSETSIDYDNLIFNQENLILFIDIKNGIVTLDSKGRIKKINKENKDIIFNYNGNRLVSSESRDRFFDFQNRFSWNGNLISQANKTIKDKKGNIIFYFINDYSYDSVGKLVEVNNTIRNFDDHTTRETIITMEDYNEYGDWIKAKAITTGSNQNEQTQEIITREITYW